jgi:hypothetical protein
MVDIAKVREFVGVVMVNGTGVDVPPPGPGLMTATETVPAAAIEEAGTFAVSFPDVTKVVARATPFQFTTEPETNPVPFTVTVNPLPPGTAEVGTSGRLTKGTAFVCASKDAAKAKKTIERRRRVRHMGLLPGIFAV